MAVFVCIMMAASSTLQAQTYTLRGQVTDAASGKPLALVDVTLSELKKSDVSNSAGAFEIVNVKPGSYSLYFRRIGYKVARRKVNITKDLSLMVALEEQSIQFDAIEITAGEAGPFREEPSSSFVTSRDLVGKTGIYSRDVYRGLQALPGMAHNEWSAKPHIKGGHPDETAVLIDNLEIYEPFHLDEIDGPFSLVGSDVVKDMQVFSGGFSARHPDKMSGIVRLRTIDRVDHDSIRASVDMMGASVLISQRLNENLSVYSSGRRSFVYITEKLNDTKYPSEVYDLWNKFEWVPDGTNRFQFEFLLMSDRLEYRQDSAYVRNEFFKSRKVNYNLWANWNHVVTTSYFVVTTLGYQTVDRSSTFAFDASITEDNLDRRGGKILTAKQDHHLWLGARHTIESGFEFDQLLTTYRYREYRLNATESSEDIVAMDIIDMNKSIDGYKVSAYGQDRFRWSERFQSTVGMRLSGQSYSHGVQWMPRVALQFDATERLRFTLAYGWYYQPDNLLRLRVYQNQFRPEAEPEKSVHYMSGFEYHWPAGATVSGDVYFKDYTRLRDDYDYDFFNRIEGVGIVDKPFETRSGHSYGLDLSADVRWKDIHTASLLYSYAHHRIANYDGLSTIRDLGRIHSAGFTYEVRLPGYATGSLQWRIHSGDPFTPTFVQVLGDSSVGDSRVYYRTAKKNSATLASFHSMDLRLEKKWIWDETAISAFVSVINVYGRRNVRQYTWRREVEGGRIVGFRRETQSYFPRFFLAGVSVELSLFGS